MAKKIIDNTPIANFEDDWGGVYQSGVNTGKEWGKTHSEVERVIKGKVEEIESKMVADIQLGETSQDGSLVELNFYNAEGEKLDDLTVMIPAPQDIGEIIQPVITTELLSAERIKLGDSISLRWSYDCIRKYQGASERANYPAQTVVVTVKIGTTTVHTETFAQVPVGTTKTITIGKDIVDRAGMVNIGVVATTQIDEETKTSRGSKSVNVISMDLATTFDPAAQLALSNGFVGGQTISIPYTYTVPTGTTLKVWVDGTLYSTEVISGTGRNYIYLASSDLVSGRHNIQMIAESSGLLSNVVCVDLLKAGGTTDYLGIRYKTDVSQLSDMPLEHAYGSTAIPLSLEQFGDVELDIAAWNSSALNSTIVVSVDGQTTQTLTADRYIKTIAQRFEATGTHTMVVAIGTENPTAYITFGVNVIAIAGVTETETVGYRTKLSATGRNNGELNPADWGGITTFTGVDWRSNGWNRGSDGVDALLLTNGATAEIDIKPFVLDATDGDYSIQNRGMTLEIELMISQVMERGATVVSCLYDNDGNGYPMGIKITTEEAGLYFGGVEEITTAEDLVDENGNYIDYEGNIVDEENKVPLKITRPHGISMNIAIDKWVHLAFVVQPVSGGYGLGMLFINGVLSRANRYTGALRQTTPVGITFDSDKADVKVRMLRYYRTPLIADEAVDNWIISRPNAAMVLSSHENNAIGDSNNTTDSDGNIAIDHDTLLGRGRGILTIIRSDDSGTGLSDLFTCTDKKQNFKADLIKWEPPRDSNGDNIGDGFEARNVRMRIQGTSSVKYPYKNLRFYLTTQQGNDARSLSIGGEDVTDTASGYPLRGSDKSIAQAVLCAKTDFVDSSLVLNTGGAHLFNDIMDLLHLNTPPQEYDSRVRQSIDGIPCDIYAGTDEHGSLVYYGQFVLNNEKSKSTKIFGMDGVKDSNGDAVDFRAYNNGSPVIDTKPIALEALTNSSPMTLFHPAGSTNSTALSTQLASVFDDGFEFNCPEDAKWATIGTGDYAAWSGAQTAIKRLMGWIYDCMGQTAGVVGGTMTIANPDYGTTSGWNATSMAKWVCPKFKNEASQYFVVNHLLTYYLFTDYGASVDQRAKNILWRTWDGLIWYATYYDGDTAQSIRNDAFMVYLYNVTRDTYDTERSKYAFEGHNSWLWCLVLANFEDELKTCAINLRNQLTTQVMLNEFNTVMQGNWSERQYNKSGKLKYIDTIQTMNYVYTLTGNRELHRTQFVTDRSRLLDARYGAGNYNGDVITFTVVRQSTDTPSSLTLKSGDLYYFGYKLNGIWLQGPSKADAGESLTMNFTQTLATNDPLMLGGASCVKELDFSNMGSQLNGTVGLSLCTMLTKLVMRATNGVSNAPLVFGNTSKLEYVDITGQTAVHTGTAGTFDISKHTRLNTLLAGNTNLTTIKLPEGAPITTLVLPTTLTTLTLRYLPNLEPEGLTLQGVSNITAFNFSECPHLSWYDLLQQCPNVRLIRVEGIMGKMSYWDLKFLMEGYDASSPNPTANMVYHGLTADGNEQTYPALIGKIKFTEAIGNFDEVRRFFDSCGLEVENGDYSIYVFDDLETDPANITSLSTRTGHDFPSSETYEAGTKEYYVGNYEAGGHVQIIHDRCQLCAGKINPSTGKMHVTKLSKNSLFETADGQPFDPADANDEGYDVFLYLPHYWYKGVNDFKNGKKYYIVSANDECPESDATFVRYNTQNLVYSSGHAISKALEGALLIDSLLIEESTCSVYKVLVDGMKRVRFPGILHDDFAFAFTDDVGQVISVDNLVMEGGETNPPDFNNEWGDYDFRNIPEGAKYFYFTCKNTTITAERGGNRVFVTDSVEIVDVEPDWVEHKAELIGVYKGSAAGITNGGTPAAEGYRGLRSISGKAITRGSGAHEQAAAWTYDSDGNPTAQDLTVKLNGTTTDFLNLALIRNTYENVVNGGYLCITYETHKDMANLLYAWFGTRDTDILVGRGGAVGPTGGLNNIAFGSTSFIGQAQNDKTWGLEYWNSVYSEYMEHIVSGCTSFTAHKKIKRTTWGSASSTYGTVLSIFQQDGNERKIKYPDTNATAKSVCRVHFGRYCDIVFSSFCTETTYTTCYGTASTTNSSGSARIPCRIGTGSGAAKGYSYYYNLYNAASKHAYIDYCSRLCFFGEIENESDLID